MIDLHCHLLPGIDDGPKSLDEALVMARMAVSHGITEAFVTPHIHVGRWNNDSKMIETALSIHQAELQRSGIPLKLGMGAEVRLSADVMPLIEAERIPFLGTLDGFKVMLLELPHSHVPLGSTQFVTWLLRRGIRPLIAHPERNREIMRNSEQLRHLVVCGCLVQLTAGAVAGEFGQVCEARAIEFLKNGWVTVLASDAHDSVSRPPRLSSGVLAASRILGPRAAQDLVETNPRRIVHGEDH